MKEKLGKYYNVISGYAFKSSDLKDSADIPIIKIGNISNGRNVIFENMQYVDHEFLTIDEKYHIKNGDVLISLTGSHINQPNSMVGRVCRNYDKQTYLLNQRAGKIFAKENASTDYLFYALLTKAMKESIVSRAYGAANQVNVSPSAIMCIKWDFPTLPTQQKIASILSAYDRLIENNTRRIRLLEQMAENLYKEWFVRFRFPEHENVEIVNGLPKGWNKKELGNIADVCMGSSPKSEYYNDEKRGLPFHQGVGSFGERFVLDNTYSTSYSQIAEPMSILFSVRAPVGRLNYTRNRIVIGRGVAAINHKEGMQSLLFYTLKVKFFKEDIIGNGAIFSSITKKELLKLKLIVANKELRVVFNNKINKIDREIDILYKQNQLLTRQRDLLLPRLMSGKLEVKS